MGAREFLATGQAYGAPYLPVSPRTLRPSRRARSDWRWTLGGGALWDHDNRAQVEGVFGPVRRARDRRAREREDAERVTAFVDSRRGELEPFQLQVFGLYFQLRLLVADVAQRLRKSAAAVAQAVKWLRARAAAAAGCAAGRGASRVGAQRLHGPRPCRVG